MPKKNKADQQAQQLRQLKLRSIQILKEQFSTQEEIDRAINFLETRSDIFDPAYLEDPVTAEELRNMIWQTLEMNLP